MTRKRQKMTVERWCQHALESFRLIVICYPALCNTKKLEAHRKLCGFAIYNSTQKEAFDIAKYSDVDIALFVDRLNDRPHKCLGWKTPYEVFFQQPLHLT